MSPGLNKKITILVVDDDQKIREMIQAFFALRSDEFNIVVAADVQQAFLKLSNQDFDMFLIDNVMPVKNGIDFAIHLKKSIKYSKTPIILMSGALQQDDVVKAMQFGLREIIVKPFTLKNLIDRINPIAKKIIDSH
jgi:DNA-binding response OmpR family regulator